MPAATASHGIHPGMAKGAGKAQTAFVPLPFEWGEAFQFDWSEEGIVIGGIYRKIQVRT